MLDFTGQVAIVTGAGNGLGKRLYRVHRYVLMPAEGPSRGIPRTDGRHDYLTGLVNAELALLNA